MKLHYRRLISSFLIASILPEPSFSSLAPYWQTYRYAKSSFSLSELKFSSQAMAAVALQFHSELRPTWPELSAEARVAQRHGSAGFWWALETDILAILELGQFDSKINLELLHKRLRIKRQQLPKTVTISSFNNMVSKICHKFGLSGGTPQHALIKGYAEGLFVPPEKLIQIVRQILVRMNQGQRDLILTVARWRPKKYSEIVPLLESDHGIRATSRTVEGRWIYLINEELKMIELPPSISDYKLTFAMLAAVTAYSGDWTLSTGINIALKPPTHGATIHPFTRLMTRWYQIIRQEGINDDSINKILQDARNHLLGVLGQTIPPTAAELVTQDTLLASPNGTSRTRMKSFIDQKSSAYTLRISELFSREMSPKEIVHRLAHEVFCLLLVPEDISRRLLCHAPECMQAIRASHVLSFSEGLANFQVKIPLDAHTIRLYAEGLRDGDFDARLIRRGVIDPDIRQDRKSAWYENPFPLGFLLFEAFSRINPEQMWTYAFTFIHEQLKGDYSLENLQRTDFAVAMYGDYAKLSGLLDENPLPPYVFFAKSA
jgi:hypothetical protein